MLYPLIFQPIFKERVWGGRNLARLYGKPLPPDVPIGESWEISDRPGDASVIANGPLAGKTLCWLVTNHARELLGTARLQNGRFPLLVKILDAQETLSLQVHPPASVAAALGGEPKTEMWYITHAAPGAELYVGLKRGVTREVFERKLRDRSVADCFHRVKVQAGDAMFLPSGRVHAISAGLVIFEIQQNSDTTYRLFDWNRTGLDSKPRELHIAESLASMDFNDFEPGLADALVAAGPNFKSRRLVDDALFRVDTFDFETPDSMLVRQPAMQILGVVEGRLAVVAAPGGFRLELQAGDFCLIPACLDAVELWPQPKLRLLRVETG